jgi:hypothetical protein
LSGWKIQFPCYNRGSVREQCFLGCVQASAGRRHFAGTPMLQRRPIFPNVIEINHQAGHILGSNVYLIFDRDEWVLIDIGYEDTVEEIIELIRELDFPCRGAKR